MGRSAAVLLLTLVLGALVAANAGGGEPNEWTYGHEPYEQQCSLGKPRLYSTWGCPTCSTNPECIKTKCSKDDGKADVEIDLKCLFGDKIGFVAVSYNNVCVTKQTWDKKIVLSGLECKDLSKPQHPVELRFIVQNKWWYNPKGKELEVSDCCYNKCTHGKPCHTCEFKGIYIPACNSYNCKKPVCEYRNKHDCPKKVEMDKCFKYEPYEHYVKVTMKKDCHKKMKHVACSYKGYEKNEDKSEYHEYSDRDGDDFWFKAACKSKFKWFFEDEDDYYVNKYAPKRPSEGDGCNKYFEHGKPCNQCGCDEPVYVGECDKGKHDKEDDQEKGR